MAKKQIDIKAEREVGDLVDYNFPAFNVTVKARDLREAEAKLQEILKDQ